MSYNYLKPYGIQWEYPKEGQRFSGYGLSFSNYYPVAALFEDALKEQT